DVKATGTDIIPMQLIRNMGEQGMKTSTRLLNNIYSTGKWHEELNESITIPKKQNTTKCSDHRTLSLIYHVSKILKKIIHEKLFEKAEKTLKNTQFGFRRGMETTKAIFKMIQITEKAIT